MSEVDEAVTSLMRAERGTRSQVLGALDSNPDEAARVVQLSDHTGVPAAAISQDVEGFERQHRAHLTGGLLRDDQYLMDFANTSPMAAKVASDDWAQLSKVSEVTQALRNTGWYTAPARVVGAAIKGFGEKLQEAGPSGSWLKEQEKTHKQTADFKRDHPYLYDFFARGAVALGEPVELFMNMFSGALGAAHSGLVEGAKTVGYDDADAERFGREATAMAEAHFAGLSGYHAVHAPEPPIAKFMAKVAEAAKAAKPWIERGVEPPAGVHPFIDELKKQQATDFEKNLDSAVKESQASTTRERAPEIFSDLPRTIHPEGYVSIPFEAVAKLYGDKLPELEDGILGWVPKIDEQMQAGAETGADIKIPIADYLAKIEKETHDALKGDLRGSDQGLTVNEAKELKKPEADEEPRPEPESREAAVIDAIRKASGIEVYHGSPHEFEAFDAGKIGTGEGAQSYGHGLYFAEQRGVAETYKGGGGTNLEVLANEWIRRAAGDKEKAKELFLHVAKGVQSKDSIDKMLQAIDEHKGLTGGNIYKVRIKANKEHFLDWDKPRSEQHPVVQKALDDLLGPASKETGEGFGSGEDLYRDLAEKLKSGKKLPPDANGSYRFDGGQAAASRALHEAGIPGIKYLDQGSRRTPEVIQKDLERAKARLEVDPSDPTPELTAELASKRVADLEAELAKADKGTHNFVLFDPKLAEITEKNGQPIKPEEMAEAAQAVGTPPPGGEGPVANQTQPVGIFSGGIPDGISKDQQKRYAQLIEQRQIEDLEAELKRFVAKQKREARKEWKENLPKVRAEVEVQVAQQAEFQLSDFFRQGIFSGERLGVLPKLSPEGLTPEQIAALPKRFLSDKGLPADAIAGDFGFQTGKALVDEMARHEQAKGDLTPAKYREEVVKKETERQMQERFGKSEADILNEAEEHVMKPTQFDILHEETLMLGTLAKQEFPLTKADIKSMTRENFDSMPQSQQSAMGWLATAGRTARKLEDALLKGDYATAFELAQKKMFDFHYANLSKKFEKQRAEMERLVKRYSKAEPSGIAPEHLNWVHYILDRLGQEVGRRPDTVAENINLFGAKSLKDFFNQENIRDLPLDAGEHEVEYEPSMIVDERLFNPNFREDLDKMSVGDYRSMFQTVKSVAKNGRQTFKDAKSGTEKDIRTHINSLIDQMEENLPEKKIVYNPNLIQKAIGMLKKGHAMLLQLETIFDRFDRGNARGLFTQSIMFPLIEAGNNFSTLQRKYAKMLADVATEHGKVGRPLSTKLDPVFKEPRTIERGSEGIREWDGSGEDRPMNVGNLRTVLLNWGNESNREKLARGYGTTVEAIQQWIDRNAQKEDWNWANAIGGIFKKLQAETDRMTDRMAGSVIEKIPLKPFDTATGQTFDGWYYPMIYDRTRGAGPKPGQKEPPPLRAATSKGFEKERTGYAGPVWLDPDMIADHIGRRLRDVAFREVVHNTGKVFYDKEFRNAMSRYFGEQYTSLLEPYLKNLVGSHGYSSELAQAGSRLLEAGRQNLVSTLIGWNPGTVMKHGGTALSNSMVEVGPLRFLRAAADLFRTDEATQKSNLNFIFKGAKIGKLNWEGSEEVQRRMQHWYETVGGAEDMVLGKLTLRQTMMKWGAKPVALSDLASTVPLWWAKYQEVFNQNRLSGEFPSIEKMHGDAVQMADRAVRRAHGSTALTSRPQAMTVGGAAARPFTSLYGFFNHIYQRFYRMAWELGNPEKTKTQRALGFSKDALFYMAVPAIIEELVTPQIASDGEGGFKKAAKALAFLGSSTVPVLRDIVHAALNGRDPAAGLITTGLKSVTDIVKDLGARTTPENKGNLLKHGFTFAGATTGLATSSEGRAAQFVYRWVKGLEKPKTPFQTAVGLRHGKLKGHSRSLSEVFGGK